MPTKRLPSSANLDHLKNQAKDLLRDFRAQKLSAYQRIREFHPKFTNLADTIIVKHSFGLVDAQLTIAREYGYTNWVRLRVVVAQLDGSDVSLNHNERIDDVFFRQALDFMDEGNASELIKHLALNPQLVSQHVLFEGDNYFTKPTLIEFVAENPIRQGKLPANIIEISTIVLEAGAKDNIVALESTLMLVASGRIVRESGFQDSLIDLLCQYGVDPQIGLSAALSEGEFGAAQRLLNLGAILDVTAAAALNRIDDVQVLLGNASQDEIQLSLAWSAMHGWHEVVALLLRSGANPNCYNPPGGHSHCTALHSASIAGHIDTVKALVEAGARFDIGDIHHNATAVEWAAHSKNQAIVDYLESVVRS